MGWRDQILRENKRSKEARTSRTRCVKVWKSPHGMESICRYENRVRLLLARQNGVSAAPIIFPLEELVIDVCGCAAMDIVLQLIGLVDRVACGVD